MSDFHMVRGFEEVWRPPVRSRIAHPPAVLGGVTSGQVARARLARIVALTPEVMVKVTGRTQSPDHLRAHIDYISRDGELELETTGGTVIAGRAGVRDLAEAWSAEQLADWRTRSNSPFSHNVILSMPAGTDPARLRDAARAFADKVLGDRHDYVFALHTDTPRPHVHLSICSRGYSGERLNPRKADLEDWRQRFAEVLRERGVEAEATPRRTRGVTRKAERPSIRRMRERHEAGDGAVSHARRSAYQDAAKAAFQGDTQPRAWERQAIARQVGLRRLYLDQAQLLRASVDADDRILGARVQAFVSSMPQPDSQRLALARALRAAGRLVLAPDPADRNRER